jgi:Kef-type K+ transport system membrane component KefB
VSLDVIALLAVLAAALTGGAVARRLGYPSILGELMAGIVLGPPMFGLLQPDDAVAVIGKLGVVLLMLYIGLHLDPSDLGRAAGAGALASLGGFLVPAGLGFGIMMLVDGDVTAALFVAVAMGVTSLATKSRILVDLGILNTRIAHVLMAGALFSDVAALIFFSALLGLATTGTLALSGIGITAAKAALFLVGTWVVGTRLFPIAGRFVRERKIDTSVVFMLVVVAGLGFGAAADAAGLHAILGSFLAGLYIREQVVGHALLGDIERRARGISVGLLAPLFFVTAGFGVSFDVFTDEPVLLVGVVVLATVGKILGTALFYLPTGYGFREGIAVGAGMNGRGAVEIIVAELALEAGLIDTTVFSILVFMAIFTTATVPIFLTRSIRWLRSKGELVAEERDGVVIVGGSAVARRIGTLLSGTNRVVVIDTNAEHADLAEEDGLEAVRGSGLDEEALELAGAEEARLLVAATGNAEVNLLAARIAATRFGIPEIAVALGEHTSESLHRMLDEIGAGLLFGRPIDVGTWDSEIDMGSAIDLEYVVEDVQEPADLLTTGHVDPGIRSLPMVVQGDEGHTAYTSDLEPMPGDRVIGIDRRSSRAVREVPVD